MALTQAGTPTISLHLLFYFTDSSVSFFHDAFLCRILNFSNVLMHTKNAYLAIFHAQKINVQFTKPFGYIFQQSHPQDCVKLLSLRPRQRKQVDFKNVMSFRGIFVSTGQLYKPLAEKHKCRKYSN